MGEPLHRPRHAPEGVSSRLVLDTVLVRRFREGLSWLSRCTPLTVAIVLLLVPAVATGDVLVNAVEPSTVPCGKSIKLGVWYQSFSGGPRWVRMTITNRQGAVVWRKRAIATTTWRYWRFQGNVRRSVRGGLSDGWRDVQVSVPRPEADGSGARSPLTRARSSLKCARSGLWPPRDARRQRVPLRRTVTCGATNGGNEGCIGC